MNNWTKITIAILVTISASFAAYYYNAESYDYPKDRAEQPIAFSHKIHAGENQMPCQYCHAYTAKAAQPGIPSVRACMGCHTFIPGEDRNYDYNGAEINFKEEITKLRGFWERGEPIPWVKFHFIPEHASFTHQPHIRAGLECAECHGQVDTVDLLVPVNKIEMGFCISCHNTKLKSEQQMIQIAEEGKELVYLKDCQICHH